MTITKTDFIPSFSWYKLVNHASIPLQFKLNKDLQGHVFGFLIANDLLKFAGVSHIWRQYILSNISSLFKYYHLNRQWSIILTDNLLKFHAKNCLYICPGYEHVKYVLQGININKMSKLSQDAIPITRINNPLYESQLVHYILNQEQKFIDQDLDVPFKNLVSRIPETALLTLHQILNLFLQLQTKKQCYIQISKENTPLSYLIHLLENPDELASACHKHPALAYLIIRDPWFRGHLPTKEQTGPSRPNKLLRFYRKVLAELLEDKFLCAVLLICMVLFPIATGLLLGFANPGTIMLMFPLFVLPLLSVSWICFSKPEQCRVKNKADAYAKVMGRVTDEKNPTLESFHHQKELIHSQLFSQKKWFLFATRRKIQDEIYEDAVLQLDKAKSPLALDLYQEKAKIRAILVGKRAALNQDLKNPPRFTLFYKPELTREKQQAIEESLLKLDGVRDYLELVLFKTNLLSNESLTQQRGFGIGNCDTYNAILRETLR